MKTYHWILIVLVVFFVGIGIMAISSNSKIAKIENDWKVKVETIKDKDAQLEALVSEKEEKLKSYETSIASLKASIKKDEEIVSNLNNKLKEKDKELQKLSAQLKEKEKIKTELANCGETIIGLKTSIAKKEEDIKVLKDNTSSLNSLIENDNYVLTQYFTDVNNLSKMVYKLKEELKSKDKKIEELNKVLNNGGFRKTKP